MIRTNLTIDMSYNIKHISYIKEYIVKIPDPYNNDQPQECNINLAEIEDKPLHKDISKYPNQREFEYLL